MLAQICGNVSGLYNGRSEQIKTKWSPGIKIILQETFLDFPPTKLMSVSMKNIFRVSARSI